LPKYTSSHTHGVVIENLQAHVLPEFFDRDFARDRAGVSFGTARWRRVNQFTRRIQSETGKLGLPPGPMSHPTNCLSGGLVDLGDRVRFLHSRYRLGPGHQDGSLGGL
jgi:hypothetical protein